MISTVNAALVESAQACLDRGISILVEKPAARSFRELNSLKLNNNATIKIGFNHAVLKQLLTWVPMPVLFLLLPGHFYQMPRFMLLNLCLIALNDW